jgi:hypothetical protein
MSFGYAGHLTASLTVQPDNEIVGAAHHAGDGESCCRVSRCR